MHAIAGVAARMDEASTAVFLTAAFGVNDLLAEMLEQEEPCYRYVLIESEDKDTERLAPRFNEVAVANILPHNEFDIRWLSSSLGLTLASNTPIRSTYSSIP
jgi:hypothetical protein